MSVQSVRFDKAKWSQTAARAWLKEHGFKVPEVDISANQLRYRQYDPVRFKSYRTKVLKGGIELIVPATKKTRLLKKPKNELKK